MYIEPKNKIFLKKIKKKNDRYVFFSRWNVVIIWFMLQEYKKNEHILAHKYFRLHEQIN